LSRPEANASLELLGHVVELLTEQGELVPAGRRHGRGEVAAGQTPCGIEEAAELAVQGA
jgi:hypothetical protein